jgi:hypothetical protein
MRLPVVSSRVERIIRPASIDSLSSYGPLGEGLRVAVVLSSLQDARQF